MNRKDDVQGRSYWVVSPNVRYNETTVSDWRQASLLGRSAFMGWGPDDRGHKQIGHKFAHVIMPGDVILIARRHNYEPEIVGFGVVYGEFKKRIKGVKTPESFGSLRKLSPFIPRSRAPVRIPLIDALRHSTALAQLHPNSNEAHKRVCKWMKLELSKKRKRDPGRNSANKTDRRDQLDLQDPHIAAPPGNDQLGYEVRTKSQVIKAKKIEAKLLQRYRGWLNQQQRKLQTVIYKKLQCDGFEEERQNLIEAKSSTSREHIRMAVGQLLDYAFQGRKKFGDPHMAILVPEKPDPNVVEWLKSLEISLIWREKGNFLDDANGQFT